MTRPTTRGSSLSARFFLLNDINEDRSYNDRGVVCNYLARIISLDDSIDLCECRPLQW